MVCGLVVKRFFFPCFMVRELKKFGKHWSKSLVLKLGVARNFVNIFKVLFAKTIFNLTENFPTK